jgi:ribosomal protein L44E
MRSVHYYGLYQPSRRKERVEDAVKASKFHDQVRPVPAASRRERMAKALNDLELQCLECGSYVILEHIEYAGKRYEKKVKGPPGSQRWQLSLSM